MGLVCSRGADISETRNECLISIKSKISSPIRYFDLLPVELFRQIIEDIGKPHTGGRQTRMKRREAKATLRSLCLTSKRFKEIAKPLLLSTVDLGQGGQMLRLLTERNREDALASIRRINCEPKGFTEPLSRDGVRYLVLYAVQLQNASLRGRGIELSVLAGSNLLILSFSVYKFSAQSTPQIRLPNLKYLTCSCCSFEGGGTPFDLPVLRHLVFTYEEAGISAGAISFLDQVSCPLLSITVSSPPPSALPPSILRSQHISRCYVVGLTPPRNASQDAELENLKLAHWIHLDIMLNLFYSPHQAVLVEERLKKISELLEKGGPNLQVFSVLERSSYSSEISLEISRMVKICRDCGLEILRSENLKISEDQNLSIFDEASLSPFTRWSEEDSIRSSVAVDL